ncbi:MAG: hypothetical protein ACAH12_10380 [Methylophilaceae bacterium]
MRTFLIVVPAFFFAAQVSAAGLDKIYAGIKTCTFNQFYYAPWDTKAPHPYFIGLQPTAQSNNDLYTFEVKDTLFGMPVVEIQVPGTWGFHSVTFNVPISKARKVLHRKFGTHFPISEKSKAGEVPALVTSEANPNQSVLYCNEPEE